MLKYFLKFIFIVVTGGWGIFFIFNDAISTFGVYRVSSAKMADLYERKKSGNALPLKEWWDNQSKYTDTEIVPVNVVVKAITKTYGDKKQIEYLSTEGHIGILEEDIVNVFGDRAEVIVDALARKCNKMSGAALLGLGTAAGVAAFGVGLHMGRRS